MNKTLLAMAGGVLLLGGGWYVGYKLGSGESPQKPRQVLTASENDSSDRGSLSVSGQGSDADTEISSESDEFRLVGWSDDQTGDTARVCLEFSSSLSASEASSYADYIDIDPATSITPEINDELLCFGGLDYGRDYNVTVRAGLSADNDQQLASDETVNIRFGDMPPFVSFDGQGIILPRRGAQGLAINTTNVDQLRVEVFRVNDRIIARRNPESGNSTASGDYGYEWRDAASEVRSPIYQGTLDVDRRRNQNVTTVLSLDEIVDDEKPGAYVVKVTNISDNADENRPANAWRWLISTDIALTSYEGEAGYVVTARSIQSARPIAGVDIDLIAENNEILDTQTTDASGRVSFSREIVAGNGPLVPVMLTAYGAENDFAMLDLRRPGLDLSERNIGGRTARSPVDAYLFTERGVYRPGERVNLTAMLRTPEAVAIDSRPGQITWYKPNGSEFRIERFETLRAGTLVRDFHLPDSAPRGTWTARIQLDGVGQVGSVGFAVEDFVPQTLAVEVTADDSPMRGNERRPVTLSARFLYGADGSALKGQAEARIQIDPSPFEGYEDYRFGDETEDFRQQYVNMGRGVTDGDGQLILPLSLRDLDLDSHYPLRAQISAGVSEPGGRFVTESLRLPIRTQDLYIGFDPQFEYDRAPRGKPAEINLAAVNWQGEAVSLRDATWTLVEEDYDYVWFERNGDWRWRRDVRDIRVATGNLDFEQGTASWSRPLSWGDYRLIVSDEAGQARGEYRFSVGWSSRESETPTPDLVRVMVPEGKVKAGDTVQITVEPPYAGYGEVAIASHKIHEIKSVEFGSGPTTLSVTAREDWGGGVYVLVSAYTPRNADTRPVPRRAVGVGYIAIDRSDQTLDLAIQMPDKVRPRQQLEVPILISGGDRSGNTWLTLAAVDEGILRLTKYDSPDPESFYFDKKALGVDMRDDYARILNPNKGDAAQARSGGDQIGGEGLSVVPVKIVSLYNGPIEVRGNTARVTIDVPDFNGELRLMAVAWTETSVGSTEQGLIVRDPVPALISLPRFLAPGDSAMATVSLNNIEGPVGSYQIETDFVGPIQKAGGDLSLDLQSGERQDALMRIEAGNAGIANLDFSVNGPEDYTVDTNYQMQVRSAFFPQTRTSGAFQQAGSEYDIEPSLWAGLDPATVSVQVSYASSPVSDPSAYAKSLYRYPYGCTEQTVSVAMPLLYSEQLGGVEGLEAEMVEQRLQASVDKIVTRQGYDGAFGLWRPGDGYASPLIGIYATDFLQRAKSEGYEVPQSVLDKSYEGLRKMARLERYPGLDYNFGYASWSGRDHRAQLRGEAAAYSFLILARAGRADLGQLRYFHDNELSDIRSPLAKAQTGAALALMGDSRRADLAFASAVDALGYNDRFDYYQSPLRDIAGVTALALEVGQDELRDQLADRLRQALQSPERLHTQEKAQVILAMLQFQDTADELRIRADGVSLGGTDKLKAANFEPGSLSNMPSFTNRADGSVWRSVTVSGVPVQAPPASSNGYVLNKRIFDMDGSAADMASVVQGDRFIIAIDVMPQDIRVRSTVLADLLPAGFEIETLLSYEDGNTDYGDDGPYAWLGEISRMEMIEARDDRFVAAGEVYSREGARVAYIVRAVTQGDFVMPGAFAEDMYRPGQESRTTTTRVTIGRDPEG